MGVTGKVKFIAQVQQFGALVQRLQDLAPLDGTRKAANMHKGAVRDLSSLEGIYCTCLVERV